MYKRVVGRGRFHREVIKLVGGQGEGTKHEGGPEFLNRADSKV